MCAYISERSIVIDPLAAGPVRDHLRVEARNPVPGLSVVVAGGVLGGAIGARPTVLIAGIGTLFSILWLVPVPADDWQPSTQVTH